MKKIMFLFLASFLFSFSLFAAEIFIDAEEMNGYVPADMSHAAADAEALYKTEEPAGTTFDDQVRLRGEYIAALTLQSQAMINELKNRKKEELGVAGGSTTWVAVKKFYCENTPNWGIDEAFKQCFNICSNHPNSYDCDECFTKPEKSFAESHHVDGTLRYFFKGYLWGGNGLKPDKTFDPLYGVDCSGNSFGIYNVAGFCIPMINTSQIPTTGSAYLVQIPDIKNAQKGDVTLFPGHMGIVTDPANYEFTWNGTTAKYNDYGDNHLVAKIYRWKGPIKEKCKFGELCNAGCNLAEAARLADRDSIYTYSVPEFCK